MSYCRKPETDPDIKNKNKTETKNDMQARMRRCLGPGCGKDFRSSWAGERICPACRKTDRFQEGGNPFEEDVHLTVT